MDVDRKRIAAVKTLEFAGYTYHGGEYWKPPLGHAPRFDEIDTLREAAKTALCVLAHVPRDTMSAVASKDVDIALEGLRSALSSTGKET